MSMPTVMASRELVDEIGGFDEQLRYDEWHDLCLRLALKSEVVAVREPLCSVRTHDEHYSGDRISGQLGGRSFTKKWKSSSRARARAPAVAASAPRSPSELRRPRAAQARAERVSSH